ncbi:Antiseptic resistance protein [Actinomyces howellii]|uniref:Antiseptic resistance protein n=1 Tax=Actinomyces howellii TaxID=52771 RepID=A0A3S4R228_9ACTO|nr:Antiseptic resistance protein [Actinomyces howellii]
MAVLILTIDSTVLSLAIPALSADLAPSATQLLWIGDIYSFALAGLLVTMGNVADRIGRRRLLLIGTVGFGLSSALAAFAPSAEALIAARALLGVSGATIMPSTLSLIRNVFPDPRHRRTAIAVWSAGTAGGTALGPLVGGYLLEHFWWGSVFLINIPVMLLVLGTGLFLLPESRNTEGAPVDLASAALSVGAIVPTVYAVKTLAHDGLTPTAIGAALLGLTLGWVFLRRQRVLTTPLIDVTLFRNPGFTWAVVSAFMAVFSLAGLFYFFSQYLQLVRGYPTFKAGLAELPSSVASILSVVLVGWLVIRLGQGRTLGLSLGTAAAGLAGLALAEGAQRYAYLAAALAVVGVGVGVASAVANAAILSAVPARRAGAASAISETAIELGAAMGIAVLGTVQDTGYRMRLGEVDETVPADVAGAARESLATLAGVVDRADPAQAVLYDGARLAFTHAMQTTACVAAIILAVAAVMAWLRVPAGEELGGQGEQDATRPEARPAPQEQAVR